MVIWLFAGGGEAELGNRESNIQGIVNFFEKHFPEFVFYRVTPVRKKRLPPNVKPKPINTLGKTGQDFAGQITAKLEDKLKQPDKCDAILVIDDLDCACDTHRKQLFNEAINQAGNGEFKEVKRIVSPIK